MNVQNEQWYTAKCSYTSVLDCDEPPSERVHEYRYFLIRGSDEENAMARAQKLAVSKQHSYRNELGATVSWRLNEVVDVKEIFDFELKEGLELYHEYGRASSGPQKGSVK
jgi:hypothetical protein